MKNFLFPTRRRRRIERSGSEDIKLCYTPSPGRIEGPGLFLRQPLSRSRPVLDWVRQRGFLSSLLFSTPTLIARIGFPAAIQYFLSFFLFSFFPTLSFVCPSVDYSQNQAQRTNTYWPVGANPPGTAVGTLRQDKTGQDKTRHTPFSTYSLF